MNLGATIKSWESTTRSPLMLVKCSIEYGKRNISCSEWNSEIPFTPKETNIQIKQYIGVRSIIKGIDYQNDNNQIKREA
jgi:hypothetical protein